MRSAAGAQEQDSCNDYAAPDQAQRKERCATGRGELYSAALDRPVAGQAASDSRNVTTGAVAPGDR